MLVASLTTNALASIAVTAAADLTGANSSRSTPVGGSPGGLAGQGTWMTGGILLDWNITFSSGTWNYSYTLTQGAPAQGGVSHWILELTESLGQTFWEGIFADPSTMLTGVNSVTVGDFSPDPPTTGDNPGMPADIWGVKFDLTDAGGTSSTVTFSTAQAPVWGDFYAKDGKAGTTGGIVNAVWNAGFSEGVSDQGGPLGTESTFPLHWVPRPNGDLPPPPGGGEIPEPVSVVVWALLASGAGFAGLRRARVA